MDGVGIEQLVAVDVWRGHASCLHRILPVSSCPCPVLHLDALGLLSVPVECDREFPVLLEAGIPRQELTLTVCFSQTLPRAHQGWIVHRFVSCAAAKHCC